MKLYREPHEGAPYIIIFFRTILNMVPITRDHLFLAPLFFKLKGAKNKQ